MLQYLTAIPLKYHGDCNLVGISDAYTIYVDEIYDTDGWVAHHAVTMDGTFLATVDELSGTNLNALPLPLPEDITLVQTGKCTEHLNYHGPRHRGLREPERIDQVVRPLTIQTKMALASRLNLQIPPPMILGLAEGTVLSEALVQAPDHFILCRRIRIAYALPSPQVDSHNQPYDYDTIIMHVAHPYEPAMGDEVPLEITLSGMPGVQLNRPLDCIVRSPYAFIAEGGTPQQPSMIHIWKIDHPG